MRKIKQSLGGSSEHPSHGTQVRAQVKMHLCKRTTSLTSSSFLSYPAETADSRRVLQAARTPDCTIEYTGRLSGNPEGQIHHPGPNHPGRVCQLETWSPRGQSEGAGGAETTRSAARCSSAHHLHTAWIPGATAGDLRAGETGTESSA